MMPTITQCQQLIDNTISTWTTINRVNGYIFISKTDTSNYIFLPASGSCNERDYHSVTKAGRYLSTGYSTSFAFTNQRLDFTSSSVATGAGTSYYGHSIRPVAPKRPW